MCCRRGNWWLIAHKIPARCQIRVLHSKPKSFQSDWRSWAMVFGSCCFSHRTSLSNLTIRLELLHQFLWQALRFLFQARADVPRLPFRQQPAAGMPNPKTDVQTNAPHLGDPQFNRHHIIIARRPFEIDPRADDRKGRARSPARASSGQPACRKNSPRASSSMSR